MLASQSIAWDSHVHNLQFVLIWIIILLVVYRDRGKENFSYSLYCAVLQEMFVAYAGSEVDDYCMSIMQESSKQTVWVDELVFCLLNAIETLTLPRSHCTDSS